MPKKMTRAALALAGLLVVSCAGGCSVARFRQQDELPDTSNQVNQQPQESQPVTLEQEDLVYEKQLTLPSGAVAATYRAELPQLAESGSKAPTIKKINQYYESELATLKEDCDSYFSQVQASYGESWQTAQQATAIYHVEYTYEPLELTDQRVSLLRTYRYQDINQQEKVIYIGDMFDVGTGWPVKLEELFQGEQSEVEQTLNELVESWCETNQVERSWLPQVTLEQQENDFALGENTLYLCLAETGVRTDSPGSYLVEIPLEELQDLLAQDIWQPDEEDNG